MSKAWINPHTCLLMSFFIVPYAGALTRWAVLSSCGAMT